MRHGLVGLLALGLAACTPTGGKGPPPGLDLYILAGQSNMVGLERPAVWPRFVHEDKIWLFGNDLNWHPGQEPTDDPFLAIQPYPVNQSVNPGISPGMAFADAMVEANGRPVGLIPCAQGGSKIAHWQPGGLTDTLYGACLAMVKQAFPMGRVRGVLFWQGEGDTTRDELVNAWAAGFANLIAALRVDLGNPDLPVVFAQIGPSAGRWDTPQWRALQAVQAAFRAPNVAMISTFDLPLIDGDEVHVTGYGQFKAGRRFAEKMLELVR